MVQTSKNGSNSILYEKLRNGSNNKNGVTSKMGTQTQKIEQTPNWNKLKNMEQIPKSGF